MQLNSIITAVAVCLAMQAGMLSVMAQEVGPAQEQELRDARGAIEAAQKRQAEKFAAPQLKLAQDSVAAAEEARKQKNGEKFSRAARLARAYAELSQALADLGEERQNLTAANESAKNARAEIERLNQPAR